jgi:hypothetical protein
MRRLAKHSLVLFSESAEMPEAKLKSNIGHRNRTITLLPQSAMDTIQPNAAEVCGRAHAKSVMECAIEGSPRHIAQTTEIGHRRAKTRRILHVPINLADHHRGPLLRLD